MSFCNWPISAFANNTSPAAVARDNSPVKIRAPAAAKVLTPEERFGHRSTVAKEERQKERGTNSDELVVTLANGQVWAQKAADSRFDLEVGDAVIVKSAALGSFLMVAPGGSSTRVSRIR